MNVNVDHDAVVHKIHRLNDSMLSKERPMSDHTS